MYAVVFTSQNVNIMMNDSQWQQWYMHVFNLTLCVQVNLFQPSVHSVKEWHKVQTRVSHKKYLDKQYV